MCIIGYAPKGATISEARIRELFANNPDGAGVMWRKDEDSPVEIRKGFMDVNSLLNVWREIPTEYEKAVHCRIATSGRISPQCCHPFPVTGNIEAMKQKKCTAAIGFMHNGMVSDFEPSGRLNSEVSDSMLFGVYVLNGLKNAISSVAVRHFIERATMSRFLIFKKGCRALLIGKWYKDGNIWYSNNKYSKRAEAEAISREQYYWQRGLSGLQGWWA